MSSTADDFFKTVLDAFPSPVFIVDRDVRIIACNSAGALMLDREPEFILQKKSGELLHCIHSTETPGGCGTSPTCRECVVRNSVNRSFQGEKVVRERTKMEMLEDNGKIRETYLVVTTSLLRHSDQELVLLVIEDISDLLKAFLPICSHCKKIRSGPEVWHSVETYFRLHHNIQFTHGICPQCARKHYPEIFSKNTAPR